MLGQRAYYSIISIRDTRELNGKLCIGLFILYTKS